MSEENFDRIANEYDEAFPPHIVEHYLAKRVRYIAQHCPPPGEGLDVGCGTGVLAGRLTRVGFTMTGLDPSQGMLDVMAATEPHIEGIRGEGSSLPFEDNTFDLVITVAALHHVATTEAVRATLIEMVRVTRPGGRLVVWDHNPRNPYWRSLMARVPQDDGTERLVPEAEIVDGLQAGGADIIGSDQLGLMPEFIPPALLGPVRAIEALTERTPGLRRLCAHNVILARSR
ncbi:MAG: methyltransferase domain-containing protein [Acidimicrobiia bacterium]|nr:methyltransferase domain-containing protein [Acidimicrobiia bacterium]